MSYVNHINQVFNEIRQTKNAALYKELIKIISLAKSHGYRFEKAKFRLTDFDLDSLPPHSKPTYSKLVISLMRKRML